MRQERQNAVEIRLYFFSDPLKSNRRETHKTIPWAKMQLIHERMRCYVLSVHVCGREAIVTTLKRYPPEKTDRLKNDVVFEK